MYMQIKVCETNNSTFIEQNKLVGDIIPMILVRVCSEPTSFLMHVV